MSGPQGRNNLEAASEHLIRHGWEMSFEMHERALRAHANDLFSWQQQGRGPYRALCEAAGVSPGVRYGAYGRAEGGEELPTDRFPAMPIRRLHGPLEELSTRRGKAAFALDDSGDVGFFVERELCRSALHVAFAHFALRAEPAVLRALASAEHELAPPRRVMITLAEPRPEIDFFAFIAHELMERWGAKGSGFVPDPEEARARLTAHAEQPVTILSEPAKLSTLTEDPRITLAEGSSVCVAAKPGDVVGSAALETTARALGLPPWAVFLQYRAPGCASQCYDPSFSRRAVVEVEGARVIAPPPWCTLSVLDPGEDGWGAVRMLDCANIDSVSTVVTGDEGRSVDGRMCAIRSR